MSAASETEGIYLRFLQVQEHLNSLKSPYLSCNKLVRYFQKAVPYCPPLQRLVRKCVAFPGFSKYPDVRSRFVEEVVSRLHKGLSRIPTAPFRRRPQWRKKRRKEQPRKRRKTEKKERPEKEEEKSAAPTAPTASPDELPEQPAFTAPPQDELPERPAPTASRDEEDIDTDSPIFFIEDGTKDDFGPDLPWFILLPGTKAEWQLEFVETLGQGGYGTVFLMRNPNTGKEYALKGIKRAGLTPDEKKALKREIGVLKFVSDHFDCFPEFYGSWTGGKFDYILMEYAEGDTLAELAKGVVLALPLRKRIEVLKEIVRCVKILHDYGIAHRDIKPQNIVVDVGGGVLTGFPTVKIVDFGFACLQEKKQAKKKTSYECGPDERPGTPGYHAPELVDAKSAIDPLKLDVFSLGIVLYVLINPRYAAELIEHPATAYDPKVASVPTALSSGLEDLKKENQLYQLGRSMTARDPANRPALSTVQFRLEQIQPHLPDLDTLPRIAV